MASLFVISSPSGGGKTTIIQALRKKNPELCYSISFTTRSPRKGESEGKDYYFIDEETFKKKIEKGEFIEWARVHGYYYGTLKNYIYQYIQNGKKVILDIDIQGGLAIKALCPDAVLIFLMPPSIRELENRLRERGTEDERLLLVRLKNAKEEMLKADEYDFKIINEHLDKAVKDVLAVIENN